MLVRLRAMSEQMDTSLFLIPAVLVAASVGLALLALALDLRSGSQIELQEALSASVESARLLLSTVAGATITFAGIVFSVSLLLMQLASSQYSPRVLYEFFHQFYTKWVIGIVVGAFAYSLIVLAAVPSTAQGQHEVVVPRISEYIALGYGLLSVMAVLGLINRTSHNMQVEKIVDRIGARTTAEVRRRCGRASTRSGPSVTATATAMTTATAPEEAVAVRGDGDGWVRQVDSAGALQAIGPGATVLMEVAPGDFVIEGAPLCRYWPAGSADEGDLLATVGLGPTRTMQQDLGFGLRQLADIALQALSPAVNAPTTAEGALFQIGSVMRELVVRELPPRRVEGRDGRVLLRPREPDFEDYVVLAFDQIRQFGSGQPRVLVVLLGILNRLTDQARETGRPERAEPLLRQARLAVAGAESRGLLPEDLAAVRRAAEWGPAQAPG